MQTNNSQKKVHKRRKRRERKTPLEIAISLGYDIDKILDADPVCNMELHVMNIKSYLRR